MYELPTPTKPTLKAVGNAGQRLRNFKNILLEEVDEVDEIIAKLEGPHSDTDVLTMIGDWLGDVQVFCASEIAKFGLNNDEILTIIMNSNFSKKNPDGSISKDGRGKIQKGANYYKPEPEITALIQKQLAA